VTSLPSWREAWEAALYGSDGFFLRQRPRDHFRTSAHASPLLARAVLSLARRHGLTTVVDIGAGGGELLTHLHETDPSLHLTGIDLAPRPTGLPDSIGWRPDLPDRLVGLVVANEWLDDVPCDVVEVDDRGTPRLVHVDPATGAEELGEPVDDPWLDMWWPLHEPGTRAEIGRTRDEAWAGVVERLDGGLAVAVDYGHTRECRPPFGTLASYQNGRMVDPLPDGSRDVTAHVALDSLRADRLVSQREMLHELGITGARPPLASARTDPRGYLRALGRASQAAELTATGGLGDFVWVVATGAR